MQLAANRLSLSQHACNRTMRVARSIADLAGNLKVRKTHIVDVLSLRMPGQV
ncbi:MAG: hypothetical protein CL799_05140 [Chromatiales bacterium]|nr:hypothetical protein [Chromatiales bacterium]